MAMRVHHAMVTTTRDRILRAAEELFAERGVGVVSLREINRAAGAKSAVAVQYHFENRSGVLKAILDKHRADVEAGRHAVLDHCEAEGTLGVRDLAGALVRPLAAKLNDEDGGPQYLQINAELVNHPKPLVDPAMGDPADSIQRWRALIEPQLDPLAVTLHRRFTAIRFSAVELGRRAATAPHTDNQLFTHQLIDLTAALLGASLSKETERLARARPRRA